MNLLELLKGGGLAILTVGISFYICGWQYYLGFFHRFGLDIHFSIPPENALGQGMQPIATFLPVPVLACALGVALCKLKDRYSWVKDRPYLALLVGATAGTVLPWIIQLTNTEWLHVYIGSWNWFVYVGAGAAIGALTAQLACANWMTDRKERYYVYVLTGALFLVSTAYYAQMRGRATADDYSRMGTALLASEGPGNGRRATATLHSSDKSLEERFKGLRFIPLLTVGDDVLLLGLSADGANSPAIVTMKKSLISALDFSWPSPAGRSPVTVGAAGAR